MKYDFFVSYRWGKYDAEARQISTLAKLRGHRVWIDREQITEEMSDRELANHLRSTLASSRFVIFFETSARLTQYVSGPPVRDRSWQEYELETAEASRLIVLYHSLSPPRIGFGRSRRLHSYVDFSDAWELIESSLDRPDLFCD